MVKKIQPFNSENICSFTGVLKLKEKGFGFVDKVFVPPYLIGAHADDEEVHGVAVVKLDKTKNVNGLVAIVVG